MNRLPLVAFLVLATAVICLGTGCKPGEPVAGFGMDRTTGPVPLTVQFSDLSYMDKATRIASWYWEFGDGQNSTEQNPAHVYTTPGSYSPRLTVTTNRSTSNTAAPSTVITALSANEVTINLPGGVPLVLVRVPAGSFMMGNAPGERGAQDWQTPQHSVNIDSAFYMGKYEVTQRQWLALMHSFPHGDPYDLNGFGDNYPAYLLSWNDAKDFVTALNTHIMATVQGSANLRLPSEAEWEYACRGGTTTRFFFGDSLDCADINENCLAGTLGGYRTDYLWYGGNNSPGGTKAVGMKTANQFGLFDMVGNVYEWVEDDYHYGYTGAPSGRMPWNDSPRGAARVLRGGAHDQTIGYCTSSSRASSAPNDWILTSGFRVARNS